MSDAGSTDRPIFVLSAPDPVAFTPRGGGKAHTKIPDRDRQSARLDGKFEELERLLAGSSSATITDALPDTDPELVIVFEVIDSTGDLDKALRAVGMEPLIDVEGDIDDAQLGADWARLKDARNAAEPVKLFLHASMANEKAVAELLRLWRIWTGGAKRMPAGYPGFSDLFKRLYEVRRWGPVDRVRTTGLNRMLSESLANQHNDVPIQLELWFRANPERRRTAEAAVRAAIEAAGGQVRSRAEIPEIGYHALAVIYPARLLAAAASLDDLTALSQITLLQSPEILYVRPGGQRVEASLDDDLPDAPDVDPMLPTDEPFLAILDGLPASNHRLLQGRLQIVDPDDLGSEPTYTVASRRHGTMVASAAIWGDLSAHEPPTTRKVVVRPVLKPDMLTLNSVEAVPWEQLPADLTIRAVQDLVGSPSRDGATPTVKVINVSLGDPLAQFDTIPSAWARAIDWLAFEHNLLFIVSAGNHSGPLPLSAAELKAADAVGRDRLTSGAIASLSANRRLLPPAESLNALTVGALHNDAAGDSYPPGYRVDPWGTDGNPSPTSAHGRGIRRSIKPDLAAAGGRQLFNPRMGDATGIEPATGTALPPGIAVAAPLDRQAYVSGTTFAAAEVARRAVRIMDSLLARDTPIADRYLPVATKALLVHGTRYPTGKPYGIDADKLVGNGAIARDLANGCLATQGTMLFTGDIAPKQSVSIVVPLPNDLALLRDVRTVTVTLAWFSPINWNHRQYRRAKLIVDGPPEIPSKLRHSRGAPYKPSERGTVQHRVIEVNQALSADRLTFVVKCADQAGGFAGTVPFAVAVTLEVGSAVNLDVYTLVRDRLRAQVRIV